NLDVAVTGRNVNIGYGEGVGMRACKFGRVFAPLPPLLRDRRVRFLRLASVDENLHVGVGGGDAGHATASCGCVSISMQISSGHSPGTGHGNHCSGLVKRCSLTVRGRMSTINVTSTKRAESAGTRGSGMSLGFPHFNFLV